jgi:hypothetical protein
MEVLNHLLRWVEQQQLLTTLHSIVGGRVSLYVDDLALFVTPNERDLQIVKASLAIFGLASGLFSNFDKSVATPLHCSDSDIARVRESSLTRSRSSHVVILESLYLFEG